MTLGLSLTALSVASLAAWLYLILLHGRFWRAQARLENAGEVLARWPAVAALVPARNEAPVIEAALASLLRQDYPGELRVVVVDDASEDGTAEAARAAAARLGASDRLEVVMARPVPPGWTGKLWALSEGLARLRQLPGRPRYLWLSDADIAHGPATLRRLVAKAERGRLDMVSLMVTLSCRDFWERLLIPPFVFFFQKLYPFAWVADPRRHTAAAAGGCTLLEAEALEAAGGFAAIRGALIDDCALAGRVKKHAAARGRGIWLGLAEESRSLRPYRRLASIWDMVARSAYFQLHNSAVLLALTLMGMLVAYAVPPLAVLTAPWHGQLAAALAGALAWGLMTAAALPTFRFYGQPAWLAALLPVAAAFYTAMTFDSALRHWRGRGGAWKGRVAAPALEDGGARG